VAWIGVPFETSFRDVVAVRDNVGPSAAVLAAWTGVALFGARVVRSIALRLQEKLRRSRAMQSSQIEGSFADQGL
jgi:hypothetical protein